MKKEVNSLTVVVIIIIVFLAAGVMGALNVKKDVTVDGPKEVVANLVKLPDQISVLFSSNQPIQIGIDETTYNVSEEKPITLLFSPGQLVNVHTDPIQTAPTALTRYVFENWSDGVLEYDRIVQVESSYELAANFRKEYWVKTGVNPVQGGSISPVSGWFPENSIIEMNLEVNDGYQLQSWSENKIESVNRRNGEPVKVRIKKK